MFLRWPPSCTITGSSSASLRSLWRDFEPFGRPLGLPERPGLKRVFNGGRRYPTRYSSSGGCADQGSELIRLSFALLPPRSLLFISMPPYSRPPPDRLAESRSTETSGVALR